MPRLFLSLLPSPDVVAAIEQLPHDLPGAHWIVPEHLHLTLRFIGMTSPDRARELAAVLSEVRQAPFLLEFEGVGTFPPLSSSRRMNVLWAGVHPSSELMALARSVERHVQMTGLRAEARAFHPHVTLARIADTSVYDVERWLSVHHELTLPTQHVSAFHLMQSTLTPHGAEYAVLASYPLEG